MVFSGPTCSSLLSPCINYFLFLDQVCQFTSLSPLWALSNAHISSRKPKISCMRYACLSSSCSISILHIDFSKHVLRPFSCPYQIENSRRQKGYASCALPNSSAPPFCKHMLSAQVAAPSHRWVSEQHWILTEGWRYCSVERGIGTTVAITS